MDASDEKNGQSESRHHQSAEGKRRCASGCPVRPDYAAKEHAIGLLCVTGYHEKEPMFLLLGALEQAYTVARITCKK